VSAFRLILGIIDWSGNVLSVTGQNSFRGTGDLAQQRLSYYCDGETIVFGCFQANMLMETSLDPKIDVWDDLELR
jgi:chitinase